MRAPPEGTERLLFCIIMQFYKQIIRLLGKMLQRYTLFRYYAFVSKTISNFYFNIYIYKGLDLANRRIPNGTYADVGGCQLVTAFY